MQTISFIEPFEIPNKKIWVTGHAGLLGHALVHELTHEHAKILTTTRSEVDLTDYSAVLEFSKHHQPDAIIMAAAKVGGIQANIEAPVDFIEQNLLIQHNLIKVAHLTNVERLIFVGSSCIYPKHAASPIPETALLSGQLERSNSAYAMAKIAGLETIKAYRNQHGRNYISVMPCNLYGIHDQFFKFSSHVLPALVARFVEASRSKDSNVCVWGDGTPMREFLHAQDCAKAIITCLKYYDDMEPINIGSGTDQTIAQLATLIAQLSNYNGKITFDNTKPNGTYRKLLDTKKIKSLGWQPQISLKKGLEQTISHYKSITAEQLK